MEIVTAQEGLDNINMAEDAFMAGAVNVVNGSLQMVVSLVHLKEGDLYKQSPLLSHYDEAPGWKVYLRELVVHAKEKNPELQISMSGLQNGLWRHKVLVECFGIGEREALGCNEGVVREIKALANYDYKSGEPMSLKDGYREDLLPAPPGTPKEEKLKEGLRVIIQDAISQPVASKKMFDDYRAGTGSTETKVSFAVTLSGDTAIVDSVTAFIQQFDGKGRPIKDYAVNLLGQSWTPEVTDHLIDCGWSVEYE